MSYQGSLSRLLLLLAVWMLATAAACGIYLIDQAEQEIESVPLRTRP